MIDVSVTFTSNLIIIFEIYIVAIINKWTTNIKIIPITQFISISLYRAICLADAVSPVAIKRAILNPVYNSIIIIIIAAISLTPTYHLATLSLILLTKSLFLPVSSSQKLIPNKSNLFDSKPIIVKSSPVLVASLIIKFPILGINVKISIRNLRTFFPVLFDLEEKLFVFFDDVPSSFSDVYDAVPFSISSSRSFEETEFKSSPNVEGEAISAYDLGIAKVNIVRKTNIIAVILFITPPSKFTIFLKTNFTFYIIR